MTDPYWDELAYHGDLERKWARENPAPRRLVPAFHASALYRRGDRVQLVRTMDPYTDLQPGALGVVTLVDSIGTVHVKWDSGSLLGVCLDAGDAIRRTCWCGQWAVEEYGRVCPSCPPEAIDSLDQEGGPHGP